MKYFNSQVLICTLFLFCFTFVNAQQQNLNSVLVSDNPKNLIDNFSKTSKTGKGMASFLVRNIDVRKWCHIAICVKDGEVDIYYKGKLQTTGILGDICKINGEPLYAGRDGGFSGLIYRLSYTPHFLTPSEVLKLASINPPTNKKYFT